MPEIRLTKEQQAVVDNRGGTLLVSAAAGSGKTKVLIDRVMKKILLEGNNVDDFLMITFTKAAATELRGKLITQLSKALAEDPANHHLQKQMSRVYLAQISTVHSFCKALLSDYAHELDLPADFRVCDEQEKIVLKQKAMRACLEYAYGEGFSDPEIRDALDLLGAGRSDELIEVLIGQMHENLLCYKDPEARAKELYKSLQRPEESDAGLTIWGKYLITEFRYHAAGIAEQFSLLKNQALVAGLDPYVPLLEGNTAMVRGLSRLDNWEDLRNAKPDFGTASRKKCDADPSVREAIRYKRDALKKKILEKLKVFSMSSEDILEDMERNIKALTGLIRLTETYSLRFSNEKKRRHVLDYNDLEHETLRLLYGKGTTPTRAAREISQRYAEIMVDEYQDTNAVQDALFYAISREGKNLFFVGDIKQSIYRFRMADPTIFRDKYLEYDDYTKAVPGQPRKILLSDNFRSHPAVLEAANCVFHLTMSHRVGGLAYTEDEALRPNQTAVDMGTPPVELHCIDTSKMPDYDRDEIEAEFVAGRMAEMLQNEEKIPEADGSLRPIRPGDMVILLRAMKDKAELYMEALRRRNIRAICSDNNIFASEEIQVLTALLQIIDNPRQDIPLLTVLLSPLFRFSAGTLAMLRSKNRSGEIYDLLLDSEEAAAFLRELSVLRDLSQELTVRGLMDEIDVRLNLRCVFGAMSNGSQRIRNLDRFYAIVDTYESGDRFGLSGFLRYLELVKQRPPAADISGGENAVRIMTVHSSKGLEFPVVFLADLSKQVNYRDTKSAVITDQELGIAADVYQRSLRMRYPTMPKNAISERIRMETLSEEMRILYVAMTRARSRLIMSCCAASMIRKLSNLAQVLTIPLVPGVADSVSSVGDWILLAALTRTESGELFRLCGNPGLGKVSEYPWKVCFHLGESFIPGEEALEEEEESGIEAPDYLVTAYGKEAATHTPAKLTATQMKQSTESASKPEIRLRSPGFGEGSRILTGTERGVAIHLAMQYLNFDRCETEEGLRTELQHLQKKRFLTAEQMAVISVDKLLYFFRSPIFARIRRAKKVIREFKFSLLEDASYYDPELKGEEILLQGITDCCIIEEDGLVVLDFKSDHISAGKESLRAEYYRGQLDAYSRALSRIFEMPVKERILWFFATDTAYAL